MPWDPAQAVPKLRPWIWAGLAVVVCLFQGMPFLDSLRPDIGQGNDFFQEWSSARNFWEGWPIYEETDVSVERYLGYHIPPGRRLTIRYNAHPPPSVLLVAPLAWLDYRTATLAWNLISLAVFGLSLQLVLRAFHVQTPVWSVFPLVTLTLLCDPLREQVRQGQLNCALLALITGAWALERSQRPGWAGILVGLAAAIKLFPGFLLIYFGLAGRWRTVVAGLVTFLAVTACTAGLLGVGAYESYVSDVVPSLRQFQPWWPNCSVWGWCAKVFAPGSPADAFEAELPGPPGNAVQGQVTVIDSLPVFPTVPLHENFLLARGLPALLVLLLLVALAQAARHLKGTREGDIGFALAVTVMLLVSPITWPHYFLVLLPAWVLVWTTVTSSNLSRAAFLILSLLLWVSPVDLYSLALSHSFQNGRPVWGTATPVHTLTVLSLQTYALVGLAYWLRRLLKRKQAVDACPPN
ncbi:MAG TPA: glycosyltransferase family 87 protein [Candidatus Anammoximicrobium sp.]|nr:glycosyltransferase family 87 protein [Candidatus Anammoximicrobium sp.]